MTGNERSEWWANLQELLAKPELSGTISPIVSANLVPWRCGLVRKDGHVLDLPEGQDPYLTPAAVSV